MSVAVPPLPNPPAAPLPAQLCCPMTCLIIEPSGPHRDLMVQCAVLHHQVGTLRVTRGVALHTFR